MAQSGDTLQDETEMFQMDQRDQEANLEANEPQEQPQDQRQPQVLVVKNFHKIAKVSSPLSIS